jgi:hypothetical protein
LPAPLSRKSRRTSLHDPTLEPVRQPPTNARPLQHQRLQPAPAPSPSRPTRLNPRPKHDVVARRADSCSP